MSDTHYTEGYAKGWPRGEYSQESETTSPKAGRPEKKDPGLSPENQLAATLHGIASLMRTRAEEIPRSTHRRELFMWATVVEQAAVGGCTTFWGGRPFWACILPEGHEGTHQEEGGQQWGQAEDLAGWLESLLDEPGMDPVTGDLEPDPREWDGSNVEPADGEPF